MPRPKSLQFGRGLKRPVRQRGQIIILMMFLTIPMFLVLAFVLNTGASTGRKVRIQNAADTAVMTEAAWVARSLNTMSMNNTAITQSVAVAAAGYALEGPVNFAGWDSGEVGGWYIGRIGFFAKNGSPLVGVIAAAVYAMMYAEYNNNVLRPLWELYEESKRAMHKSNNQGLARAAMGLGRMNNVIVMNGREALEPLTDNLMAANGVKGEVTRYQGWSDVNVDDKRRRNQLSIPVVRQSFYEAFQEAKKAIEAVRNSSDPLGDSSIISTLNKTADATSSVRNAMNIYSSGTYATALNFLPVCNPELDYFGNFGARGYSRYYHPNWTCGSGGRFGGPWTRTSEKAASVFGGVYQDLKDRADGEFYKRKIIELAKDVMLPFTPGCIPRIVIPGILGAKDIDLCEEALEGLMRSLINPLLDVFVNTGVEPQDIDIEQRLFDMFFWSAMYRKVPYSNWFDFASGTVPLPFNVGRLYAPPWYLPSFAVGFYNGLTKIRPEDQSKIADLGNITRDSVENGARDSGADRLEAAAKRTHDQCLTAAQVNYDLCPEERRAQKAPRDDYCAVRRDLDRVVCDENLFEGTETARVVRSDSAYKSSSAQYRAIRSDKRSCPVDTGAFTREAEKEVAFEQKRCIDEYADGRAAFGRTLPSRTLLDPKEKSDFEAEGRASFARDKGLDFCEDKSDSRTVYLNGKLNFAVRSCEMEVSEPNKDAPGSELIPSSVSKDLRPPNWVLWRYEPYYQYGIRFYLPIDLVNNAFKQLPEAVKDNLEFSQWDVALYAIDNPRMIPEIPVDIDFKGLSGLMAKVPRDACTLYSGRDEWSLLHLLREDTEPAFAKVGFPYAAREHAAVAQAEVFNGQWYDLYTQNWRSKLVPVTLPFACGHRQRVRSVMEDYRPLHSMLHKDQLKDEQIEKIIAH